MSSPTIFRIRAPLSLRGVYPIQSCGSDSPRTRVGPWRGYWRGNSERGQASRPFTWGYAIPPGTPERVRTTEKPGVDGTHVLCKQGVVGSNPVASTVIQAPDLR